LSYVEVVSRGCGDWWQTLLLFLRREQDLNRLFPEWRLGQEYGVLPL
jgi:hypothetical protein